MWYINNNKLILAKMRSYTKIINDSIIVQSYNYNITILTYYIRYLFLF